MENERLWTPGRDATRRFAELSGDWNPIHLEASAAQAVGFDDIVVHGMCVLGAAAQAATSLAQAGRVLRSLDARFAGPAFPEQTLHFTGKTKERPDGTHRVSLAVLRGDGEKLLSPATFSFLPVEAPFSPGPRTVVEESEDDVLGEEFAYAEDALNRYADLVCPNPAPPVGVPPMSLLLGMTGVLEKAFAGNEPERPGMWVHLRQTADFYVPVEVGTTYQARILQSKVVVRTGAAGAHLTIPLLFRRVSDGALAATASCVLFYSFSDPE